MAALLHQRPHRLLLDMGSSSSSPDTINKTRGSYSTEANFDTNMVIILAALLCALICALGLNSIVRCALRCSHRFAFETPDEAAARLAAKGLKKSALRQIPIAVYGSGDEVPATECPICLGEFVDGEKVRILPNCNHGFHVKCIDTWLQSHSSCPTCRQSVLDISRSSDTAAAAVAVAGSSAAVTVAAEAGTRNNGVGNASGGPEHVAVVVAVNEVG